MSTGRPWERSRPAPVPLPTQEQETSIVEPIGKGRSSVHLPVQGQETWSAEPVVKGRSSVPSGPGSGVRLSSAGLYLLRTLLHGFGLGGAEERRLLEMATDSGAWSRLETELALVELWRAGAVELRTRFWGEKRVHLPTSSYRAWLDAVFPATLDASPADDPGIRQLTGGSSSRLLSRVLLGIMAQLARSGPQLTVKGQLRRKMAIELETELRLPEEGLQLLWIAPAWTIDYPPATAITLDWMASEGLLGEATGGWQLDWPQLVAWIELPLLKRERGLLRWLTGRALCKGPSEAACASVSALMQPDCWYSLEALESAVQERSGTTEQVTIQRWLELLRVCGWGEFGEDSEGNRVFQLLLGHDEPASTEAGGATGAVKPGEAIEEAWEIGAAEAGEEAEKNAVTRAAEQAEKIAAAPSIEETIEIIDEEEPLLLQADGEIWAGSWSAYRSLWLLELIAERGELRELTSYRLTARSLARLGLVQGSGSIVRELLEQACGCKLPAAVSAALEEWLPVATTGAHVEESCEAESGLFTSQKHPPIILAAAEAKRDRFWSACHKLESPTTELAHSGAAAGRSVLRVAKSQAVDPFGLELLSSAAPISPLEEGAAELGKLPAAWTGSARSYHGSTSRQLIESAVNLGLPVELGTGELRKLFVPTELHREEGARWSASGFYRCELTDDRIPGELNSAYSEPIRLIVPQ
ncbi:hypothetical protein [Paenibacillus herberti]|uniref:Helicase XPB/Ssl2 N-terminal domain-containing protein n=1 Tax=Paenibacillus herberti TaxID=1619309 RepID=A0A229P1R2_9BACL|nr:hypothetical protein [Paenibacillus herberti]OXM15835.1 hypothetical protein CGZ75_03715 [Paenibacillus herberti]